MLSQNQPEPICADGLTADPVAGIRHGFFTRAGGVSNGLYAGLNVGAGSNDKREAVAENRRRVARWVGAQPENLSTLFQIHSPDVVIIDEPLGTERPKADAMVTNTPGMALGVLTADCGPILFADKEVGVIGAAHAGWKGALTGVLENTIKAMEALGAKRTNVTAILGPSISQRNYEVGPEFIQRFKAADSSNSRYFVPSRTDGHALFDLQNYTIDRLGMAGVNASMTGQCTYADENRFFSFRRATHRKEPDYGRQISVIMLEEN